tara:strand:- start:123 stop:1055 length:933 start_codon:yes stop_codon:yes gene_type:complete
MNSALIIGFGSIGKRHASILTKLKRFDEVFIFSSQNIKKYKTISFLRQIKDIDPSYIVIASTTNNHFKHLSYCEENLAGKTILIEKPIFDKYKKLKIINNTVYVGYNLRFHPVIQRIKKEINNLKLFNVNIQNSSYLPNWRSNQDYSKTSSAKKVNGGGVLLDISHELDFIQYLFGKYSIDYSFNKKISRLNISTDDILIMNGHIKIAAKKNIMLQVNLNFFSTINKRELYIDGEEKCLFADLINSKIKISNNKKQKNFSYKGKFIDIINKTYIDMHKAAISHNEKIICTYQDGIKIIKDIENIKKKRNK